ncbi:MAG: glycerate kinase type-2 family protein [Promethearchaeota archaeon]
MSDNIPFMYIKNYRDLLSDDLKEDIYEKRKIALIALEKAIKAVKPSKLLEKNVMLSKNNIIIQQTKFNLKKIDKIYIIGAGKATAEMAIALEHNILQKINIPYEGIINAQKGLKLNQEQYSNKIIINFASHPIPDENGVKGTEKMVDIIKKASPNDLIFCLISGGGSALMELPKNGITLKDLQNVNSLLLECGANIHEINTIRKHLSSIKGGNLAKINNKNGNALMVSLIISDVIGDTLDTIASGPTVPDLTTYKDARNILEKYNLLNKIPKNVKDLINKGCAGEIEENPKPKDNCFKKVYNFIIGSASDAANAVLHYLEKQGYHSIYLSNKISGEAKDFGKNLPHLIDKYKLELKRKFNSIENYALIGTGELTVTIKGKGIGGRNQEMLLSFTDSIKKKKDEDIPLIIGANLDGIEGNSHAMGALVDKKVIEIVKNGNINTEGFLENNDSNTFFKLVKSEIITGSTGCNVNDIIILIK